MNKNGYQFKYKFEIGNFNAINYNNKMIIFNETQLEVLDKISDLNQTLINTNSSTNAKYKELVLLNSNAGSLFDNDTFQNIIFTIQYLFFFSFNSIKFYN